MDVLSNTQLPARYRSNPNLAIRDLVGSKQLLDSSVPALTLALDPAHDTKVNGTRGLPSTNPAQVLCFDRVMECPITKSTSPVPIGTDKWNFAVTTYPVQGKISVTNGNLYGSAILTPVAITAGYLGNVVITYADDGADFDPLVVAGVSLNSQMLNLPDDLMDGMNYLIGMGVEIICDSSELNTSGTLTTASFPQGTAIDRAAYQMLEATTMETPIAGVGPDGKPFEHIIKTAGVNAYGPYTMQPINLQPKNLSELTAYPNFSQNHAFKGSYAVIQTKPDAPQSMTSPCGVLALPEPLTTADNTGQPIYCSAGTVRTINTVSCRVQEENQGFWALNSKTTMGTNLSALSTFLLKVRFHVMKIPTAKNDLAIATATNVAPYDPMFFEILSRVWSHIPAHVEYGLNPNGEWWLNMAATIAKAAAPFLMMIPHPAGKAAGVAAGALGSVLESNVSEKKKKRKANNANQKYGQGMKKNKRGQVVQQKKKKGLPAPSKS